MPSQTDKEPFDYGAVHVMIMTGASSAAILEALLSGLAATGADLAALTLRVIDARMEASLRLTGVSCAAARAFSDRMACQPGILSSRVEHHLLRP